MSGFGRPQIHPGPQESERFLAQLAGTTLIWPVPFREAMAALAQRRNLPRGLPAWIKIAVVESRGVVLLWPCGSEDRDRFPVRVSPKERRVSIAFDEALQALHIDLPPGISVGVPAIPFRSPSHGHCLALHFQHAEFLYKKSRSSAIGRLPGYDGPETT